jgi:PST family polysaccharide transporter
MVAVVTGFVALFKDMGLSAATVQKEEISQAQISTLFWINVTISTGVMLAAAAAAPAVAWFYQEPLLTLITVAYAPGILFGGLTVQHEALLRRQMRFAALAALDILSLVLGLAVAIVLAWEGLGYWALVANQLVAGSVYAVSVWAACSWRPSPPARNAGVRSMLTFGGNLTGFNVVNYCGGNLDNLLVGRFWGAQQLGLYAKAYQLLLLPIDQINTPFATVSVPVLSRLIGTPERYRQAYLRILEKLAIVTMPLASFMIGTSDWLVRLVLGPQWTFTAELFMILGFAAFIMPVLNSTGWLFMTQNRTHDLFRWGLIDVTLKVVSIVAGLPWGPIGVAVAIVLRMYVQAPLLFWYVGRKGPVRAGDFYRVIASPTCAFLFTLAALFGMRTFVIHVDPLVGLAAAFGLTACTNLAALISLPTGRAALHDLKSILLLLLVKRPV